MSIADVHLRPDGILEYRYHDGVMVDLAQARQLVLHAATLVDSPRPTLVVVDKIKGIDREARSYFAHGEDNGAVTTSVALVLGNPVARMLGNFFLGLNKPRFPTRLFTSEADAVAWLLASERGERSAE
jgi:hypothetical protein